MSLSILKTSCLSLPVIIMMEAWYSLLTERKQLSVESVSAPNKEAYLQGITRKFFTLPLPLPNHPKKKMKRKAKQKLTPLPFSSPQTPPQSNPSKPKT